MTKPQTYFRLGRNEEKSGRFASALLFYLSAFCATYNGGYGNHPGTIAKIRMLQRQFDLSDDELCDLIHSYGWISDDQCKQLLRYAIYGNISGINAVFGNV